MKKAATPKLDQRSGQWLKGVLDLCVLGVLRDGEAYGYQLSRMLEEAGLGVIKGGTLYPVLNRLESDGYLDVSWRASEQGPDRKYYTLTTAGSAVLESAAKEWVVFAETTRALMASAEVGEAR